MILQKNPAPIKGAGREFSLVNMSRQILIQQPQKA